MVLIELLTQIVSPESSSGNTHLCIIYKQNWLDSGLPIRVPESINRYTTASTHAAQKFEQTNRQKNIIEKPSRNFTQDSQSEPVSQSIVYKDSPTASSHAAQTFDQTQKQKKKYRGP